MILNLLVLSDCLPCKILEERIAPRILEKNLNLRKIVAKPRVGTENYILVASDGSRTEAHMSSFVGFPSMWISYPDGTTGKVVMGVEKEGKDALDFLLEERHDN